MTRSISWPTARAFPIPEVPRRVDILKAGAEAAGCAFEAPNDAGTGPIAAVHTPEYLTFLRTIHPRWRRIEGASEEVIPNIHPANRTDGYPKSAVGQAGFHQADTACPISAETWGAAYWSAQTALAGADTLAGGARASMRSAGRRGTMPLPISPGGSAFSTMPASRRSGCCAMGCGRRSWMSTCITATARRASSMPAATC